MLTLPLCCSDVDGPTHTLGSTAGEDLVEPRVAGEIGHYLKLIAIIQYYNTSKKYFISILKFSNITESSSHS